MKGRKEEKAAVTREWGRPWKWRLKGQVRDDSMAEVIRNLTNLEALYIEIKDQRLVIKDHKEWVIITDSNKELYNNCNFSGWMTVHMWTIIERSGRPINIF